MPPPQIPDAPIEPGTAADVCGGITRSAVAVSLLDDWVACQRCLTDLLEQICEIGIRFGEAFLRRQQQGRRLKEPEAKSPFDESIQSLLPPASIRVNHRLIQIALPCSNSDSTLAYLKSFVPRSVFDMAKRLCSSASPIMCQTDWKSAMPNSESPKIGTVSSTDKSIDRRNGLTENKSCPSDPDFSRAEHDNNEGRAETAAAWVAATAAPHHATGNRDLLSGFVMEYDDLFVHAADGIPRKVIARGAVITDAVVLPDVWFVPGLTGNLVSVSQLTELDHSIGFGRGECCIKSEYDGKIVGKGRLQKGVYVLDFLKIPLAI